MYSYGSSARGGGGKRGHGGRPYRPPPDRNRDDKPPSFKECDCLIELDIPEYTRPEPQGRTHSFLGGRQAVTQLIKHVRSTYRCHVEIPGRKTSRPVAIVGQTYQDTIPATACLIQSLVVYTDPIRGRVRRSVKHPTEHPVVQGYFAKQPLATDAGPWFFFESEENSVPSWSVLACTLEQGEATVQSNNENGNGRGIPSSNASTAAASLETQSATTKLSASSLQICWDNVRFRHGSSHLQLDVFCDWHRSIAFCAGLSDHVQLLHQEIMAQEDKPE